MCDSKLLSLMSHTLGSIGQIVKPQSLLIHNSSPDQVHEEITRIYEGYVKAVMEIINK